MCLLLGSGFWLLVSSCSLLDIDCSFLSILSGYEVIGFVSVCFFDDGFPAGQMVESSSGMTMNVCVPRRDIILLNCFDFIAHPLLLESPSQTPRAPPHSAVAVLRRTGARGNLLHRIGRFGYEGRVLAKASEMILGHNEIF